MSNGYQLTCKYFTEAVELLKVRDEESFDDFLEYSANEGTDIGKTIFGETSKKEFLRDFSPPDADEKDFWEVVRANLLLSYYAFNVSEAHKAYKQYIESAQQEYDRATESINQETGMPDGWGVAIKAFIDPRVRKDGF